MTSPSRDSEESADLGVVALTSRFFHAHILGIASAFLCLMECLGRTEEFQRDRFSDLEASAWRDYEEEYQWGFSYSPVPFLRVCSGGMHVRSLGTDRPSQWCRVGRSPGEEKSLSFEYLSLASSFLFGLHPEKPIGPRHASTGRVDRMGSLSVTP